MNKIKKALSLVICLVTILSLSMISFAAAPDRVLAIDQSFTYEKGVPHTFVNAQLPNGSISPLWAIVPAWYPHCLSKGHNVDVQQYDGTRVGYYTLEFYCNGCSNYQKFENAGRW